MNPIIRGTVVRWREDKGFGFVRPHPGQLPAALGGDSRDVFVWWGAVVTDSPFKRLAVGDEVEVEVRDDPKGPRAVYAWPAKAVAP